MGQKVSGTNKRNYKSLIEKISIDIFKVMLFMSAGGRRRESTPHHKMHAENSIVRNRAEPAGRGSQKDLQVYDYS